MSGKLKVKGNLGLAMKLQNALGQYEPPRDVRTYSGIF